MRKYYFEIEVNEDSIKEQITEILNCEWKDQMRSQYTECGRVMTEAVKELIYSKKDQIVEMVVDRAVREIVKKGLPKLLERMDA